MTRAAMACPDEAMRGLQCPVRRDVLTDSADLLEALAAGDMKLPDVISEAKLVRPPVSRMVETLAVKEIPREYCVN